MKSAYLFMLCIVSICCCLPVVAELLSVSRVTIHFDTPKTIFVITNSAESAIERAKHLYLRRDFVLDATTEEKGEKFWCKRFDKNGYVDVFRDKHPDVEKLESMQSASPFELRQLLGDPIFLEEDPDYAGTTIFVWRTYSKTDERGTTALQVAAGFNPHDSTNILFLIVSVGNPAKN